MPSPMKIHANCRSQASFGLQAERFDTWRDAICLPVPDLDSMEEWNPGLAKKLPSITPRWMGKNRSTAGSADILQCRLHGTRLTQKPVQPPSKDVDAIIGIRVFYSRNQAAFAGRRCIAGRTVFLVTICWKAGVMLRHQHGIGTEPAEKSRNSRQLPTAIVRPGRMCVEHHPKQLHLFRLTKLRMVMSASRTGNHECSGCQL